MSSSRESGDSLFQIGKSDEPINTPKRYKNARSPNQDLLEDGLGSISDISPLIDRTHSAVRRDIEKNNIEKQKRSSEEQALALIREIKDAKAKLARLTQVGSDVNDGHVFGQKNVVNSSEEDDYVEYLTQSCSGGKRKISNRSDDDENEGNKGYKAKNVNNSENDEYIGKKRYKIKDVNDSDDEENIVKKGYKNKNVNDEQRKNIRGKYGNDDSDEDSIDKVLSNHDLEKIGKRHKHFLKSCYIGQKGNNFMKSSILKPGKSKVNYREYDEEDEKIKLIQSSDDDEDNGTPIIIGKNFRPDYDFDALLHGMNETTSTKKVAAKKKIKISVDHLPTKRPIDESDVRARMTFKKLEKTEENQQRTWDELVGHLHSLKMTIKHVLKEYFVDVAKQMGIKYGKYNSTIGDWQSMQDAIRHVDTYSKAQQMLVVFFLSFDLIPNYRELIANTVLNFCNMEMVPEKIQHNHDGAKTRAKKYFIVKLVTAILNEQRKNVNGCSQQSCGYWYTITRPEEEINSNATNYRIRGRIYDWMVGGTFVS
jgi:hypothetical protein